MDHIFVNPVVISSTDKCLKGYRQQTTSKMNVCLSSIDRSRYSVCLYCCYLCCCCCNNSAEYCCCCSTMPCLHDRPQQTPPSKAIESISLHGHAIQEVSLAFTVFIAEALWTRAPIYGRIQCKIHPETTFPRQNSRSVCGAARRKLLRNGQLGERPLRPIVLWLGINSTTDAETGLRGRFARDF